MKKDEKKNEKEQEEDIEEVKEEEKDKYLDKYSLQLLWMYANYINLRIKCILNQWHFDEKGIFHV